MSERDATFQCKMSEGHQTRQHRREHVEHVCYRVHLEYRYSATNISRMANFERARNVSGQSARVRGWLITLNNYTEEELDQVEYVGAQIGTSDSKVIFICWGKEVGESGTPHLQGFIYLKNPCSRVNVKRILTDRGICRWDIRPCTTEKEAVINYCEKQGDFTCYGKRPAFERNRVACERAKEKKTTQSADFLHAVARGAKDCQLMMEFPTQFLQHFSKLEALRNSIGPQREPRGETLVLWLVGSAGTGKSRVSRELLDHPKIAKYEKAVGDSWWCGSKGATNALLLDDFDETSALKDRMKNICDRYVQRLQTKGGSVEVRFQFIIVTSNRTIEEVYAASHQLEPMKRRCVQIQWPLPGFESWGDELWEPTGNDCLAIRDAIAAEVTAKLQKPGNEQKLEKLLQDCGLLSDLHANEVMSPEPEQAQVITPIFQDTQPLTQTDHLSPLLLPQSVSTADSSDEGLSQEERKERALSSISKKRKRSDLESVVMRPRMKVKRPRFSEEERKQIARLFIDSAAQCSDDESEDDDEEDDDEEIYCLAVDDYEERLQQEMEDEHDIRQDQRD